MTFSLVSVAIRDEPGALAWLTGNLARWQVNIKGFVADPAGMQLLVTDTSTVTKALDEMGYLYRVAEVHEVVIDDQPGALARLCSHLAGQGIDITLAFGVATAGTGRVYLAVDDIERAAPIFAAHGEGPAVISKRLGRIGPITR